MSLILKEVMHAVRALFLFCSMCLCGVVQAQAEQAPSVLRTNAIEGNVLMLPSEELAAGEMVSIDGVRISISVEGDFRVYRATQDGKQHHIHVARDDTTRLLAFDPGEGRFRDVLPSLRVELINYTGLDDVVEAAGGMSGKVFEPLGFAIVRLPSGANPAEVARRIESLPEVVSARIQLQGPINVPM